MFCPTTGALLKVDDLTGEATCPLSGWSRSLEGTEGMQCDEIVLASFSLLSQAVPLPAISQQSAAALQT